MLSRKTIAFDIQNLTDARYFAAWGVDYLHFDFENITISDLLQIVDWVAGVQVLLSITKENWDENKDNILSKVTKDQLHLEEHLKETDFRSFSIVADPNQIGLKQSDILIYDLDAFLLAENITKEIYLKSTWTLAKIKGLSSMPPSVGLIFKGGEEEKVGYKSYDDLDIIFEYLEVD